MDEYKFWDIMYIACFIVFSDMFLMMITAREEVKSTLNGRQYTDDEINDELISLSYIYYAKIDDFPGLWDDKEVRKREIKLNNQFDETDLNYSSMSNCNNDFRKNRIDQNVSHITSTATPSRNIIRKKRLLLNGLKENKRKIQYKRYDNNASTKTFLISHHILSYLFPIFQLFYMLL